MTVDPWDHIGGLSATEALCVLALGACEPSTPRGADGPLVTVEAVAVRTGMSHDTARGALQRAVKKGACGASTYIGTDRRGHDSLRVGYRLAGGEG